MPRTLKTPPLPWTLHAGRLARFRKNLLVWFRREKRDLPWRRARDPYRIWISEIMLQQTRVAAVVPYYERFLRQFPTVQGLARARTESVLRLWAGLGYYSRARNLHLAAKQIIAQHNGEFPQAREAALVLPGIGSYTAAAVLSIAYDVPLAVLDGNVARVLARLGAIRGDLRQPQRWRSLESAAESLLAPQAPGEWNEAMMELGATVCTPRAPLCAECPVASACRARALGIADELPAARNKRAKVRVTLAAAVLLDPQGRTLLVRPSRGNVATEATALFSNLWQFPAAVIERDAPSELARALSTITGMKKAVGKVAMQPLAEARHTVTFREVTLVPYLVRIARLSNAGGTATKIIPLREVSRLAVSSATRKIASAAKDSYS